MPLMKLDEIEVAYGAVKVLLGITLDVGEGEIATVLGANGAGKTTMAKTIAGFMPLRKGTISFMDRRIDRLKPFQITELGIAHVPEGRKLFNSMTVEENLIVGSYLPSPKKRRKKTMEWLMSLFPILGERRNQTAGTLSGGEQQMLAIGRGLMSLPQLLMLDEPSLGLAPIIVHRILETISTINQEGTTILLIEQNVSQVLKLANRGFIMERGIIVKTGTGRELLEDPDIREAYLGLK